MPTLLSTFLIDMAQKIIVENIDLKHVVKHLLEASPIAARHTSIIHLTYLKKCLTGQKYVWAQKSMQPWGQPLPSQCNQCSSFRSWGQRKKEKDGLTAVFQCMGRDMNGYPCDNTVTFYRPENLKDSKKDGGSGDWISIPWP